MKTRENMQVFLVGFFFLYSSAIYDQVNKDVSMGIENVSQLRTTQNLVKEFLA